MPRKFGEKSAINDTLRAATLIETGAATTALGGTDAETIDGYHASDSPTAGLLLVLDGNADFPLSTIDGYSRGYILRGGAADWEAYNAKVSGQILVGDGTDIVSVAISGDATLAANGTLTVDHDACDNFVADEHVAHSGVTLTAGNGLTGGGTIAANRTFAVGAGSGITVNADDVALTWGTPTIGTIEPDDAASAGTGENPARSDHQHAIACAAAGTISPDDSAAEGSASSFARSDHTHEITCAAAGEIVGVAAAAEGSASSFARSDHTHQIQHSIADNHVVTVDDADAADNDYAKFTANGLEGRAYSEMLSDLSGQAGGAFDWNAQNITNLGNAYVNDGGFIGVSGGVGWTYDNTGSELEANATLRVDGDLDFVGAQQITTTAGDLTLAPTGDLLITPTGGDTDVTGTLGVTGAFSAASGAFAGNVDITDGGDLTVGANIFFVDASGTNVGINCAPDAQFDLDVAGNLRAQGWIVGKHAIQLDGALMICHYDGAEPYETDYTVNLLGHMGQIPSTESGSIVGVTGKFLKGASFVQAATNLEPNPSFEVDTTGWVTGGTNTIAQSSDQAKYGSYSLKCTYQDTASLAYDVITLTAAAHSLSAWVYIPSDYDGTQLRLRFYDFTGATGTAYADADMGLTDQWQLIEVPNYTIVAGDLVGQLLLTEAGDAPTAGKYVYLDAVQCTATAFCVPYRDGSMPGAAWSGTAHASTTTITAAVLAYTLSDLGVDFTSNSSGSIGLWLKRSDWDGQGASADAYGFRAYVDANNYVEFRWNSTVEALGGVWNGATNIDNSGSLTGQTDGEHSLFVVTWDFTGGNADLAYYWDGEVQNTYSDADPLASNPTNLYVGSNQSSALQLNGGIDELFILDRAMTADEVRAIYESNAPVFAETSTWMWRSANNLVWADSEGLWGRDDDGNASLAWCGVDSKSWGGKTLDKGDFLLGRAAASRAWVHWDNSAGDVLMGIDSSTMVAIDGAGKFWVGASDSTERMEYNSTDGLILCNHAGTAVIEFEPDGDALISGKLQMPGASSAIAIGATPPTAADTGTGIWIDRTGLFGLNSDTQEFYINATDGTAYAGAGAVILDSDGLHVDAGEDNKNSIRWMDGATNVALARGYVSSGHNYLYLYSKAADSTHIGAIDIWAEGDDGTDTQLRIESKSDTNTPEIWGAVASQVQFLIRQNQVNVYGGLYVGDASTVADADDIWVAADGRFGGGVYVGSTGTDPDANDVYVDDNVSALSFTDRTPMFIGDALEQLRGIRADERGEIDHSSLPPFACKTVHVVRDGRDVYEDGRDIGAMVSMLTTGMQQLLERVEQLERGG